MHSLAHVLYWTNLYLMTACVFIAQMYLCVHHPLVSLMVLGVACWCYSASARLRLLLRLLYLDHPLSNALSLKAVPKALQRARAGLCGDLSIEAQLYYEDAKEEDNELEAYCANLAQFVALSDHQ